MATSISPELGGEIEGPLRYLLVSGGVGVGALVLKSVGYAVGGPGFLFTSWLAVALILVVTGALAVKTSKAGGGVLLSVLVVFLPVAAEREFDIVLGIGHPNPGVLYGAALALAVAVPVGVLGYLIGQRW
jgi:hypothetical protein